MVEPTSDVLVNEGVDIEEKNKTKSEIGLGDVYMYRWSDGGLKTYQTSYMEV